MARFVLGGIALGLVKGVGQISENLKMLLSDNLIFISTSDLGSLRQLMLDPSI